MPLEPEDGDDRGVSDAEAGGAEADDAVELNRRKGRDIVCREMGDEEEVGGGHTQPSWGRCYCRG